MNRRFSLIPQKSRQQLLSRHLLFMLLLAAMPLSAALAQAPSLKVDLDFKGRKVAEVNKPGYASWAPEEGNTASYSDKNLVFSLKGTMATDWYKAGVQPPVGAQLVNDGLLAESALEMRISGLPAGKHHLLTFHNTFADPKTNTYAPIDIYVDGKLVVDNLKPTIRARAAVDAATAYLELEAKAGQDVVLRFEPDPGAADSSKQLLLNGFELNTPNIKAQASRPLPADRDEHVDAGNGLTLKWTSAKEAVAHDVYFGSDSTEVAGAGHSSARYKGKQNDTSFTSAALYSMQSYYWRVDEIDAEGNITKGDVWYFRPRQLAFPGAEGYGRFARGGRGGKVVEVTNLNDSGPGSLREAVEAYSGPRTIVFNVSGNIQLESRLVVNEPYITIAGQTAPGKGIVITGAPIGLTGDDGMIRFLRVRIGAGRTYDGMGLTGANHSIVDHCSISWTIDEGFSSRGAYNITLQRTLISEALNVAGHNKYEEGKMHGYAASIGGEVGSFHHNLLAHNYGRNWSLAGGVNGDGYYLGKMDIRNNVVYNWGHRATDGGAREVNFVGNYYKPGPATSFFYALNAQHEAYGKGKQQYYFAGNVMPGHFGLQNQEDGRTMEVSDNAVVDYKTYLDKPFFESHVTTQSAIAAYKNVLSDVGMNLPLDSHDQRIIQETIDSSYTYMGEKSALGGMIDTEKDVGGLEDYPEETRPENWDADHDGLPNWWEEAKGTNINSTKGDFSESNADTDKDGFTALEHYLHWLAVPHFFLQPGKSLTIEAEKLFKGFTAAPEYAIIAGEGKLSKGRLVFQPASTGFHTYKVAVKDKAGDTMERTIQVYVKPSR